MTMRLTPDELLKNVIKRGNYSGFYKRIRECVRQGFGIPKEAENPDWWEARHHYIRGQGFTDDAGLAALAGCASIGRLLAGKDACAITENLSQTNCQELANSVRWPVNAVRTSLVAIGFENTCKSVVEGEFEFPGAVTTGPDDRKRGEILAIKFKRISPGQGLLIPDAHAVFMKLGNNFLDSLKNVAKACDLRVWWPGDDLSENTRKSFDIVWGLYKSDGKPWFSAAYKIKDSRQQVELDLKGPSLGGAFLTAIMALIGEPSFSATGEFERSEA